jgi:hypothetical protein
MLFGRKKALEWKQKRAIRKKIQKNRYNNFYQIQKKTAMPEMALFFLDVYKYVSNLKKELLYAGKSERLRQAVFNYYLDDSGAELLNDISPENIKKDSLKYDTDELSKRLQANTALTTKKFDAVWLKKSNKLYNQIVLFSWFVNFDYITLLAQFGPFNSDELSEGVQWTKIKAELISESLKDFLAVTGIFTPDTDWNAIFKILFRLNGTTYDINAWLQLEKLVSQIIESEIFSLIVKYTDNNIEWENKTLKSNIYYAEDFIERFIENAQQTFNSILANNERKKIKLIVDEVFNTEKVNAARYYTDDDREDYEIRGCGGFTKTAEFNYILSFLNNYFGPIKLMVDTFAIKGFWVDRAFPKELSMIIQNLYAIFNRLSEFDRSFSNFGENGLKLQSLLVKTSGKKVKNETLQKRLDIINLQAEELITSAAEHLSLLNINLMKLKTDRAENKQNVLRNWREIGEILRRADMGLGVCIQKINDLLELLELLNTTSAQTSMRQSG